MARDELVELLAHVRRGVSLEELRALVPSIHKDLSEIQRKRSHFLEDACAAVLKQSVDVSLVTDDSGNDSDGEYENEDNDALTRGVAVCVAFAAPLVSGLAPRTAGEDAETTRQRAVLVAFILAVLGRPEASTDDDDRTILRVLCQQLAALVVSSGMDLATIVWTLRLREELHMFRSMMLPKHGDTGADSDDDDDEEEQSDADDDTWLFHYAVSAAGLSGPLEYFLKETGHEYAFASWSSVGIVRLVALLVTTSDAPLAVSIVSPYSNLFAIGAVAQALLQGQTIQTKRQGLAVLKSVLATCAPGGLVVGDAMPEVTTAQAVSFEEASAAFRRRDWLTPLVELASNAMVSFPEADDRTTGLAVFRRLLHVVEIDHRFWLIRRLALRCPYGNIAAILVDQLRNDTFRVWSSGSNRAEGTPYASSAVVTLIIDLLKVLVERDLKLNADLLASVASLIRFVAIRDKENLTGLRAPDVIETVRGPLGRLQSRLRSTIDEAQPRTSGSDPANLHALLHDENARFVLVEAALDSTIDLLSS